MHHWCPTSSYWRSVRTTCSDTLVDSLISTPHSILCLPTSPPRASSRNPDLVFEAKLLTAIKIRRTEKQRTTAFYTSLPPVEKTELSTRHLEHETCRTAQPWEGLIPINTTEYWAVCQGSSLHTLLWGWAQPSPVYLCGIYSDWETPQSPGSISSGFYRQDLKASWLPRSTHGLL